MNEARFTGDNNWLIIEHEIVTVGITDQLLNNLNNISYIELPEIGDIFNKNDVVATLTSNEGDLEIYAPISGEIIEINEMLIDTPESINSASYEDSWFFKIYLNDETELEDTMSEEEYKEYLLENEEI